MYKNILKVTMLTATVLLLASCGGALTGGLTSDTPASSDSESADDTLNSNPFPFGGGSRVSYANCNVIEDQGLRELCLGGASIELNDLDKCLTLSELVRMPCVTGIASKRKDINICAKLSTAGDRDLCRLGFNAEAADAYGY